MTTSQPILDAASRLRRFKALTGRLAWGAIEEIYGINCDFPQCVARDESLVAAWALEWLREDDGEAAPVGIVVNTVDYRLEVIPRTAGSLLIVSPADDDSDWFALVENPTRGHTRYLLAALGHDVTG